MFISKKMKNTLNFHQRVFFNDLMIEITAGNTRYDMSVDKENIENSEKIDNNEKKEKSAEIVRSIKVLESVLRSAIDANRKARVKKDIDKLKMMLQEMYPDSNLKELEDAIYSDIMAIKENKELGLKDFEYLKNVQLEMISPHKEDREINEVISLLKHFQERIWVSLSDQHLKLDFSNSSERDTLNRKLDECIRALKTFSQTIEDIEKSRASEYLSQLQLMRVRHGRLLLFDVYYFFKAAKKFVSGLISNYEIGGNMILNPDDLIEYEDYEKYSTFKNKNVLDVLHYCDKFIDSILEYVNVPDIKQA